MEYDSKEIFCIIQWRKIDFVVTFKLSLSVLNHIILLNTRELEPASDLLLSRSFEKWQKSFWCSEAPLQRYCSYQTNLEKIQHCIPIPEQCNHFQYWHKLKLLLQRQWHLKLIAIHVVLSPFWSQRCSVPLRDGFFASSVLSSKEAVAENWLNDLSFTFCDFCEFAFVALYLCCHRMVHSPLVSHS